jgi:dephospho-CoA kinase
MVFGTHSPLTSPIMIKIAVTGGIACGKSLVGSFMSEAGIPVCEADTIGHRVLEEDESVRSGVVREFGTGVIGPSGQIDRVVLGRLVFSDSGKRKALNALTHPVIMKQISGWLAGLPAATRHVAVIIPLLYEIGAERDWDKVVCVAAPEADQLCRLAERGLTPDEARARLAAQMSLALKMERADFMIYNCGSKPLLEEQTKQVMRSLRGE